MSISSAALALARARAAARARARDDLQPRERERIREARAELGAAIRDARARRSLQLAVDMPFLMKAPVRRRLPWRLIAVTFSAVVALLVIALIPPLEGAGPAEGEPGAASSGGAVVPEPVRSRGRSHDVITLVVGPPEPEATAAPVATAAPGSGTRGGTGSGGTRTRPAVVTETRFYGRVVDARTGRGLAGVCIVIGNRTCEENPIITDRDGDFSVRLPAPGTWDLNFALAGYVTAYRQVTSGNTQASVNVGTIRLPPR